LQLLIFRQDAPLISPHAPHLAEEPYRASGLVLWHEAAEHRCPQLGRYRGGIPDMTRTAQFGRE
jgi:hypothetical protein